MFSPYYAWARRHAPRLQADPSNHCAVNVALYGRSARRWAMTERGSAQLQRESRALQIGPSGLRWQGDALVIDIDEVTSPWPSRIRGRITVHPTQRFEHTVALAPQHRWHPIAPASRVEVELEHPNLSWHGAAYLDSNEGDAPLEQAFRRWDWSRAHLADGRSAVVYDVERCDGSLLNLGLQFCRDGSVENIDLPTPVKLPGSGWRVARGTRCDSGTRANLIDTLTDAPFYVRSRVEAHWLGEPVTAMHESLSLTRFDSRWVQSLLPFRMPRSAR